MIIHKRSGSYISTFIIEFIKQVGEKRSNVRLAKHFISFATSLVIQEHECQILFTFVCFYALGPSQQFSIMSGQFPVFLG